MDPDEVFGNLSKSVTAVVNAVKLSHADQVKLFFQYVIRKFDFSLQQPFFVTWINKC